MICGACDRGPVDRLRVTAASTAASSTGSTAITRSRREQCINNCRGHSTHWLIVHRSQDVEAHFSARHASRLRLANSRMFGTNGAYASVRARIGDTRRILDLRTSGEAAEWCGAHIVSTRRRMDRASTVAPSSRASTVETIDTDETN